MENNMETKKIIEFWDSFFQQYKPMKIDKGDVKVENDLDKELAFIGNHANRVLEIGTGSGYGLLATKLLGNTVTEMVGFDPSQVAVDYLNETLKLSDIHGVSLHCRDHHMMEELDDHSFDAVITLNVLDVLEPEVGQYIIKHIDRIIKPGGYFLLKLNFYLDQEVLKKMPLTLRYDNVYEMNGVIRAVNYTALEWAAMFPSFKLLRETEYERIKDGPKDRVLLFQKN